MCGHDHNKQLIMMDIMNNQLPLIVCGTGGKVYDDINDLEEELIRSEVKETVNEVKNPKQLHKAVLGFQVYGLNNGIYRIDNYKNLYITQSHRPLLIRKLISR